MANLGIAVGPPQLLMPTELITGKETFMRATRGQPSGDDRSRLIRAGFREYNDNRKEIVRNCGAGPTEMRHWVNVDLREAGHKLLSDREALVLGVADVVPAMKSGRLKQELGAMHAPDEQSARAGVIVKSVETWEKLGDSDRAGFPGGLCGWIQDALRGAGFDTLTPDECTALDHSGVESLVDAFGNLV